MEEELGNQGHQLVRCFLRTAVVVDDEAYMARHGGDGPNEEVLAPSRGGRKSVQKGQIPVRKKSVHSLNAQSVMDAFSSLGVVCGVVSPTQSEMEAVRRADIVVLDWFLHDSKSDYTLKLLRSLLAEKTDRNSLRLVAIYTGEARLEDIHQILFDELRNNKLDPKDNGSKTAIPYRHGQIVIYAKSAANLANALKDRSTAEDELPQKLMEDFASMTEGLLPSIALTSLTAVRQGEHKILDRFCAELDPAFLTHRACLHDPEDAERQIVAHIAEELRGLADAAVAAVSPAGKKSVELWIRRDGRPTFTFGDREIDLEKTAKLVTEGLKASELGESAFKNLSAGFARLAADDLDERLAWLMSFRTVYNEPPPILWLGSVVTMEQDGDHKHLICMRPRCDSIRLDKDKKTTFNFLSLAAPSKGNEQIVIRTDQGFTRQSIKLDPYGWFLRQFQPTDGQSAIVATSQGANDKFEFKDASGMRYKWQGELKAEYAQRIAQTLAAKLSRVAIDESEWLRRMAGKNR